MGGIAGGQGLALMAAMDAVDTGIMLVDTDFHIVFVNAAYRGMFDLEEAICFPGANYADVLWILSSRGEYGSDDDVVATVESRLAPIRRMVPAARTRFRPNGRVLSVKGVPLGDRYVYTYADVTETHRALERSSLAHKAMVVALADLAEYRDTDTGDHVVRVSRMTYELAREMRRRGTLDDPAPEAFCAHVALASVLHDVGKVAVADTILRKPGALSPDERQVMERHCDTGFQMLSKAAGLAVDSHYLRLGREIARHHHERWDGMGYPEGRAGREIPLSARIVAVADVYDALTSARPYKPAWDEAQATRVIAEEAGRQFDPLVVEAFAAVMAERHEMRQVQWDERMSVGDAVMDHDHRTLIGLANQLALPRNRSDRLLVEYILDELVVYAAAHFAREEVLMAALGFPGLDAHRRTHAGMARHLRATRTRFLETSASVGEELHSMLGNWLRHHILVEDMAYKEAAARRSRSPAVNPPPGSHATP